MPGKEIKLIRKTLHADGYYTASIISTSEAATSEASEESTASTSEVLSQTATSKRPHIKLWFRIDKGLIIGLEQREKLMREEEQEKQAAAVAKEEIPTPGFVLVQESDEDDHNTSMASTFQSKLDATKRKMHDSYQQLANAKKQRRIQVIDPRDLPPPPQSSSKGKGSAVAHAARKKMITTTNRINKTRNFFDGGGRPKLMKPTSIF